MFFVLLLLCVLVVFYKNVLIFLVNYHIYLVFIFFAGVCIAVFRGFCKNFSIAVLFFYSVFYWAVWFEFLFCNLYFLYCVYDILYIIFITSGVW